MKRSLFLTLIVLLLVTTSCQKATYSRIDGFAQGGTYHVIYSDLGQDGRKIKYDLEEVSAIIDHTLKQIDHSISGYNKGSILSKINNNQPYELDSIFIEIFTCSYKLYLDTDGHFDITGAPLFDFWGFGFKDPNALEKKLTEKETKHSIDSILQFVGMDKIYLEGNTIIKKDPRVKLNFNAIAQGYSCDLIGRELEKLGIQDYLVEVGMEILCKGKNAKAGNWRIAIDAPIEGNMTAGQNIQEILELTDVAIVTSGNYRKFHIKDGKKYTHTIDPKTGYPVTQTLLSATIIAPDATTADALATYCMVVGTEKALSYIETKKELQYYFISSFNSNMEFEIASNI